MVVQHKNHFVAVDDIQNTKLWKRQPVLKKLHDNLQERPGTLRIGVSNGEGDSLHSPQLMQKLNASRLNRF